MMMLNRWLHYFRVQLRDVVELYALPLLAVVMPWPWCFALYKRCAQSAWLYRQTASCALAQAQALGYVAQARLPSSAVMAAAANRQVNGARDLPDAATWLAQRKLVTLVDHADHYLSRTRSSRWLRRYLDVQGQWPEPGKAAVLCTFHWGAGMWSLRHARHAGLKIHALAAPLQGAQFAGRPVLHAYAKARTASAAREMGRPTLDASQSMRPVLKALKAGEQVLAVVDVPPDTVNASLSVPLLGRMAQVPRGLLRLAAEQGLPVVVFVVGINLATGRRYLHIESVPQSKPDSMPYIVQDDVAGSKAATSSAAPAQITMDADALTHHVFARLQTAIDQEPAAWHLWSEAPRFFAGSDASA
jgi:lauroyl/myristoyl acyltransferase